jgi:hypothetical protein
MRAVTDIVMSLMDGVAEETSLPDLLCRDACRRLGLSGAGIALMDSSGMMEQLAGSDERSRALENLQLTLGEGPCIDAHQSGGLVLMPDLSGDGGKRWPGYGPAAHGLGVRAVFCYPLRIGGIRLGVFDIFRDRAGTLEDEELGLALDYADVAILILLHLQSLALERSAATSIGDSVRAVDPALDDAFRSHPEVHQATGMASVQAGVGLREALLMLRARAFASDRTLDDVAHDVVDRAIRFS